MKSKAKLTTEQEQNIVDDYRNGVQNRTILQKYSIQSSTLADILDKYAVERRGRGHNFKNIWDRSRLAGITPAGHSLKTEKKKSKAKVPVFSKSVDSEGVSILKKLLGAGVITQSDIQALADSPSSDSTTVKISASEAKRRKIIRLHKKGIYTKTDIKKLVKAGYRTVVKVIEDYEASLKA